MHFGVESEELLGHIFDQQGEERIQGKGSESFNQKGNLICGMVNFSEILSVYCPCFYRLLLI